MNKIKSVTVIGFEDKKTINEQYTKAVSQIAIKRVPPEYLDLLIKKLIERGDGAKC